MQVVADIDEADIGEVREGQRVSFTVDAYPDDTFEGRVTQVRQEATTESNVVTYQVVISAPNASMKLKPGLTANVTIYTMEVSNVLSVPTEEQSIQDCQAKNKVWMQEGNVFKAYPVTVGISNGILTEIKTGVKAGQKVITEFRMGGEDEEENTAQNSNPFMPKPPTKKK